MASSAASTAASATSRWGTEGGEAGLIRHLAAVAAAASFVAARLGASPTAIAHEVAAAVLTSSSWTSCGAPAVIVEEVLADSLEDWWSQGEAPRRSATADAAELPEPDLALAAFAAPPAARRCARPCFMATEQPSCKTCRSSKRRRYVANVLASP